MNHHRLKRYITTDRRIAPSRESIKRFTRWGPLSNSLFCSCTEACQTQQRSVSSSSVQSDSRLARSLIRIQNFCTVQNSTMSTVGGITSTVNQTVLVERLQTVPKLKMGNTELEFQPEDLQPFYANKAKIELRETPENVAEGFRGLRELLKGL